MFIYINFLIEHLTMMISISNLTKSFKNRIVLDNVNMDFDCNINFLQGSNGVGKTTLINILAGIVKPNKGLIYINNNIISYTDGRYKKNIGFFLNYATYPYHLTISEYIDLLNLINGIDVNKNKTYQEELISFFSLKNYLNQTISELSTGYITRVKLFAAMLHNPDLYIFDEPFTGLDKDFIPLLIKKIIDLSMLEKKFLITTHLSKILSHKFPNRGDYSIIDGHVQKIN